MKQHLVSSQLNSFTLFILITVKVFSYLQKNMQNCFFSLFNRYKDFFESAMTFLFLGSLFVSVSYLFLHQLAEHGW